MHSWPFRLIAMCELLGCVLLLAAQAVAAQQGFRFTPGYLAGVGAGAVLAAAAGLLLLRGRESGRRLSLAVQALQVLNVSTAHFSYQVALGPVARLRLQPDGWLTQFGAYGNAAVAFAPLVTPSPEYAVNVAALVAGALLLRHRVARASPASAVVPAV